MLSDIVSLNPETSKASHQVHSKSTHQVHDVMLPGVLLLNPFHEDRTMTRGSSIMWIGIASVLLLPVEGNLAKRVSSLRKHTVSSFNHQFYSFTVSRDA